MYLSGVAVTLRVTTTGARCKQAPPTQLLLMYTEDILVENQK